MRMNKETLSSGEYLSENLCSPIYLGLNDGFEYLIRLNILILMGVWWFRINILNLLLTDNVVREEQKIIIIASLFQQTTNAWSSSHKNSQNLSVECG